MVPGRKFSTRTSADCRQPAQRLEARVGLEVERDAALVAVDAHEVAAFAGDERRAPLARLVAACRAARS